MAAGIFPYETALKLLQSSAKATKFRRAGGGGSKLEQKKLGLTGLHRRAPQRRGGSDLYGGITKALATKAREKTEEKHKLFLSKAESDMTTLFEKAIATRFGKRPTPTAPPAVPVPAALKKWNNTKIQR